MAVVILKFFKLHFINFFIHLCHKSRPDITPFQPSSGKNMQIICKLGPTAWCDKALPVFWNAGARQQRWKTSLGVFILSRFQIFPSILVQNAFG